VSYVAMITKFSVFKTDGVLDIPIDCMGK